MTVLREGVRQDQKSVVPLGIVAVLLCVFFELAARETSLLATCLSTRFKRQLCQTDLQGFLLSRVMHS